MTTRPDRRSNDPHRRRRGTDRPPVDPAADRAGFRVEVADDGEAALQSVGDRPPSLILLDVGLPGMDGFEVCRRLKSSPATRLTPVVLLTGLQGREHRIAGINAGADDFLSKPFDFGELRARVRSLVRTEALHRRARVRPSPIIVSLALTVEARDAYTEGHCERLAHYAMALGAELGFGRERSRHAAPRRLPARRRQDRNSRTRCC